MLLFSEVSLLNVSHSIAFFSDNTIKIRSIGITGITVMEHNITVMRPFPRRLYLCVCLSICLSVCLNVYGVYPLNKSIRVANS